MTGHQKRGKQNRNGPGVWHVIMSRSSRALSLPYLAVIGMSVWENNSQEESCRSQDEKFRCISFPEVVVWGTIWLILQNSRGQN